MNRNHPIRSLVNSLADQKPNRRRPPSVSGQGIRSGSGPSTDGLSGSPRRRWPPLPDRCRPAIPTPSTTRGPDGIDRCVLTAWRSEGMSPRVAKMALMPEQKDLQKRHQASWASGRGARPRLVIAVWTPMAVAWDGAEHEDPNITADLVGVINAAGQDRPAAGVSRKPCGPIHHLQKSMPNQLLCPWPPDR